MSQSESALQSEIRLAIGQIPSCRIFRNNQGQSWVGKLVSFKDGRAILENARPLHAGLQVGSGDLIGWRTYVIQGIPVARFASVEVKAGRNVASPEQLNWQRVVQEAGGIAGIVRTVDEAVQLFR